MIDAYNSWDVSSVIIEMPKHMAVGYAMLKHDWLCFFKMGMFATIYYCSGNIYYFGGLVFLF